MQTNLLEYLEVTVKICPYKTAFTDGVSAMTFREVHDQARAIGTWLGGRQIRGNVAVLMKKHPRTITAFLGVLYAGGCYVPLDEEMPQQRLELILKKVKPKILICDEQTNVLAQQLHFGGRAVRYEDMAFAIIREELLREIRRTHLDVDPAYIVFTSGSTGIPKGVVGCHRSAIDYTEGLCQILPFDENSVFGNQTPLYFDACLKEILPALKYGATVHLIPRQLFLFPVRLVEYLNTYEINTLCWVVSALTMISSTGALEEAVPGLVKTVAFASEVFPVRQLKLWRKALPEARFFNLYGPTETTGICCWYEVDREFSEEESLPIGQPFPNTQILLLDEAGQRISGDQPGEICIRGTRLTLGYYDDPDRTGAAFVQNPLNSLYPETIYRTGDMGFYNKKGELVFLGRKDHQIKHMGHRIELGEIEGAASACPGVQHTCCVYEGERKKLYLYYTGSAGADALTEHLRSRLPRYMLPNRIVQLGSMPFTPNGKIDRVAVQNSCTPL